MAHRKLPGSALRGRSRPLLIAASAAVLGVPLLAAAPAGASPDPAPPSTPAAAPADLWGLREKLRAEHGDTFGGLYADAAGRPVLTAIPGGEGAVRAAQQRLAGTFRLTGAAAQPRVVTVKHSLDRLEGLKAAVVERDLMGAGPVNLVDVDETTNRVYVGLEADTPANRAAVLTATGATADEVSFGVEQPATAAADRYNDSAPWNAGDGIYNERTLGRCTSGFGVHQAGSGTDFLLTAAHCSEVAGQQDFFWNGASAVPRNSPMGFSQNVSFGARGWDTQLIRAESSTLTWTATADRNAITAAYTPVANDANKVINEGSVNTPWQSGLMNVSRVDFCTDVGDYAVWGTVEICHLWQSRTTTTGAIGGRKGDSGGPVVSYSGFGPLAVGQIVAIGGTTSLYFHAIGDLLAKNPHRIAGGLHVNSVNDPG
jgi:hypothetical protein